MDGKRFFVDVVICFFEICKQMVSVNLMFHYILHNVNTWPVIDLFSWDEDTLVASNDACQVKDIMILRCVEHTVLIQRWRLQRLYQTGPQVSQNKFCRIRRFQGRTTEYLRCFRIVTVTLLTVAILVLMAIAANVMWFTEQELKTRFKSSSTATNPTQSYHWIT